MAHNYTTSNGRAMRVNLDTVYEVLAETLDKKQLKKVIDTILSKKSERSSTKVNDDGLVYCSYFGEYLPADEFDKKADGKFRSRSKLGDKLYRATRAYIKKATDKALKDFRDKTISAEELDSTLKLIEQNSKQKFNSLEELEEALKV